MPSSEGFPDNGRLKCLNYQGQATLVENVDQSENSRVQDTKMTERKPHFQGPANTLGRPDWEHKMVHI